MIYYLYIVLKISHNPVEYIQAVLPWFLNKHSIAISQLILKMKRVGFFQSPLPSPQFCVGEDPCVSPAAVADAVWRHSRGDSSIPPVLDSTCAPGISCQPWLCYSFHPLCTSRSTSWCQSGSGQ